jgi:CTP:molybdopterin cytidylyltransferase MocA
MSAGAAGPVAAITAAGASRRMGEPKALLRWDAGTVLTSIVATLARAGITETVVVLGSDAKKVGAEASRAGASTIVNGNWERGRFGSVRMAAKWARDRGRSLLLWPVDCPGVRADTVRKLVDESAANPDVNVVPRFAECNGHPVVVCAETVSAIVGAEDDCNLRDFMHDPDRRLIDVDDPAVVQNLNGPADYRSATEGEVETGR